MDDSLKAILEKHWSTLVRYINPTQSLIAVLVEDRVLPAAMINDVQKGSTRREKNEILLKSIRLRGNTSYRKFRDAMMKCGQIFLADLLYEEETPVSFLEESDFSSFPALKLSLPPPVLKQFILLLDAKIRARMLKKDWKADSNSRLELLTSRAESNRSHNQAQASAQEKEEKIKQLSAEMNMKNDLIRSLSLDINILNAEVDTFTQLCSGKTRFEKGDNISVKELPVAPSSSPRGKGTPHKSRTPSGSPNSKEHQEKKCPPRFSFLQKALSVMNGRLTSILGLPESPEVDETRIDVINGHAGKVQELVSQLQESVRRATEDREAAMKLLLPDTEQKFSTVVTGVGRFLMREQRKRYALLKDIDRLSRKLRGMSNARPNSGLYALLQSAVTGTPSPDIVDYRFLSNHLSLVEADAEHVRKKLLWKDADVKNLQEELSALRAKAGGDAGACPGRGHDCCDGHVTVDDRVS